MDHHWAHECPRGPLALFGQETDAERDGNEQQGEQSGACRSHQQIEVVPSFQRIRRPHKQIPILPQPQHFVGFDAPRPSFKTLETRRSRIRRNPLSQIDCPGAGYRARYRGPLCILERV